MLEESVLLKELHASSMAVGTEGPEKVLSLVWPQVAVNQKLVHRVGPASAALKAQ